MRLVIGLVIACGCHHGAGQAPGGSSDGGRGNGDAGVDSDPAGPPLVVATTQPGWLHEPIRIELDKALASADVTSTATFAGAPVAATVAIDPEHGSELVVALDPHARGTGTLAVHVEGQVTADNGQTADIASDVAVSLDAWSETPALGITARAPALVVTPAGEVLAAWSDGSHVIVAVLDRGTFRALGDPLGAATGSPAIALDEQARPVVAWSDGTAAHVARWDGTSWSELPSPGAAVAVALASPPGGGAPFVATFGSAASVQSLAAGDTWQPIGGELAGAFAGEPALAVAAPDRLAIGWLDTAGTWSVERFAAGSWTALAPIGGVVRASLAARGDVVAVAYERWSGSSTVLAAKVAGAATSWTGLGHALDAGPADDAVAPSIALDSAGAPIVAWSEHMGTRDRGLLARWDGSAWTIAAGASWLPERARAPTATTLALHAGDAPVVAASAGGQVVVARFNGPVTASVARTSMAGCALDPTNPPALLSQTGCFAIASEPVAHPGLVAYGVVVELWSDGALKRRWIGLPDGATMTAAANGSWTAPPGTMVVKEFALETTPGDPTTRRPIETRFLVNDPAAGWRGFSYRWQLDGLDATLQPDGEDTFAWPLSDGTSHTHFYPSRTDCVRCHQSTQGPLLGVRGTQLARWFDYDGVIGEQPAILAMLRVGPASNAAPLASPHDPSRSWELRTRGYMAANCAHCHNPSDVAVHDLRWETPLAATNLCPDITPGDPAGSRVYQLVSSRPGMPPLGTLAPDPLAVQILGTWIATMSSCP
jgi:hypothetical protein